METWRKTVEKCRKNIGKINKNMGKISKINGQINKNIGKINKKHWEIHKNIGTSNKNIGKINKDIGNIHKNSVKINKNMGKIKNNIGNIKKNIGKIQKNTGHGSSSKALRTGSNDYHSTVWCLEIVPEMEALRTGSKLDQIIIAANFLLKNFSRNGSPSNWIKSWSYQIFRTWKPFEVDQIIIIFIGRGHRKNP